MKTNCLHCGVDVYDKPNRIKSGRTKYCSRTCKYEHQFVGTREEIEDYIGEDLEIAIRRKYNDEFKSIRMLVKELNCNNRTVLKLLEFYGIETRKGSEAVKTQWINNDERREAWGNMNRLTSSGRVSPHRLNSAELNERCERRGLIFRGSFLRGTSGKQETFLSYTCNECSHDGEIRAVDLKIRGCGACGESKGEGRIKEWLELNNYHYEREKWFDGCRHKNPLPFDFAVYSNDKLIYLIEYDGIQHFESSDFFGGKTEFKRVQFRDAIKNKYCMEKQLKLIRIPYTEFENIESILTKEFAKADKPMQLTLL